MRVASRDNLSENIRKISKLDKIKTEREHDTGQYLHQSRYQCLPAPPCLILFGYFNLFQIFCPAL